MVLPECLGLALAADPALQRRVDDQRAEGDLEGNEREGLCAAYAGQGTRQWLGSEREGRRGEGRRGSTQ